MRSQTIKRFLGLLIVLFFELPGICSYRSEYTNGTYRRQGCGLMEVPTDIPSDAKKVYLTNNQISSIPAEAFSYLTGCTEIWLENNTLTLIDAADFVGLESLKGLNLEDNLIADIKPYAFVHLEQCTHIWLYGNKLTQIKMGMFKGLQFLEKLAVSNNNIMDIANGTFSDMRRCKELHLNSNQLTYIKKGMLEGLESLQILSVMYNKISNIEGSAFDHIPQCTELWLYDNELIHVRADAFEKLSQLMILDLAKNRILGIEPGAFTKLTRLKRLHLHRNRLSTLRRNAFSSQHQTNLTLILAINPLLCDNKMSWIKRAEQDGWITLNYTNNLGSWTKPDCGNYPDHTWDSITLSCPLKGNRDDNENYISYIAGGVTGVLLLFFIIIFLFLASRRGKKSKARSEDTHAYMNLLRWQALPDPPTNQQHVHPSSSQPAATTTPIPFPRHYVTPLPGRDSNGYEVPVQHADCASQEPLYSQIQDGEDNYDNIEIL